MPKLGKYKITGNKKQNMFSRPKFSVEFNSELRNAKYATNFFGIGYLYRGLVLTEAEKSHSKVASSHCYIVAQV